jgi:hypothetical protein
MQNELSNRVAGKQEENKIRMKFRQYSIKQQEKKIANLHFKKMNQAFQVERNGDTSRMNSS